MDLKTLGEGTKIDDNTYYFAINYAAQVTPFVVFSLAGDSVPVEINGHNLPCHSGIVRLPLSLDYAELLSVYAEPFANLTFTRGGKSYAVKAYFGSQKYTPPAAWQWSFRWSNVPPYYLPDAARASFNATPLRNLCDKHLVVWLNDAGQMLGLPVFPLSEGAEAGGVEMVQNVRLVSSGQNSHININHTPAGTAYETVRFCTPPLTADDMRTFCSFGSARFCYLKNSGSLMPIEVSGSFSWSAVGTGECATFSAKIYSKNVTYVKG